MNSQYYDKYLKYKAKYLDLKDMNDMNNNYQTGGKPSIPACNNDTYTFRLTKVTKEIDNIFVIYYELSIEGYGPTPTILYFDKFCYTFLSDDSTMTIKK